MAKKKTTKKTKALAKSKQVKDLVNMFAGSSSLVQNDKTQERDLILRVAEAFDIPATCVNVMGGLPYINKDGLSFKLDEYEGDKVISLTHKKLNIAIKGGDRAISEATLVLRGKGKDNVRTFNAIGEADEKSIKLSAVKQTPNMMAETRAQNRVIRKAISARMMRDLYTKLGGKKKGVYTQQEQAVMENAVQSSAEEMSHVDGQVKKQQIMENTTPPSNVPQTKQDLMELSINKISEETDPERLNDYKDKISKSTLYTENQKKMLYGALDNKLKQCDPMYGKN